MALRQERSRKHRTERLKSQRGITETTEPVVAAAEHRIGRTSATAASDVRLRLGNTLLKLPFAHRQKTLRAAEAMGLRVDFRRTFAVTDAGNSTLDRVLGQKCSVKQTDLQPAHGELTQCRKQGCTVLLGRAASGCAKQGIFPQMQSSAVLYPRRYRDGS